MPATIKVQPPVDEEVTAEDLSAMTIGQNNVVVRIYLPKPEQRYRAPAEIEIRPAALSTAGDIKQVEIHGDGQLLATRERSPHNYMWSNVPRGTHTITVRALTTTGRTADAKVTVHVE
ncbi:MAG TPA: Ig-like domain-containing protein [Thermoanaerobaculia bacterium]|nr:Ig-like domain-containing protein [Thermoanaerobaculia bacterium]